VAKYARAEAASVDLRVDDERLRVEIRDDGVGGADLAGGTGLRGLCDRVDALDGRLELHSPLGEGTTVAVELPVRR
jgi:signal transduction histidine kinase